MNHIANASIYLTETLLGLALYVVLLRFWMQWVAANFRNPIGQLVINITNPIVIPLRQILPSIRAIDTATIVLAFVIAILKTYVLMSLYSQDIPWFWLLRYSLGELIKASIYIFMGAIIIQIIASWIDPHSRHPVLEIANSIAQPLTEPARKILPAIGGLDLSPILVFLFLRLSLYLVVAPLQSIY